jgi:EmrB/QacA subfamily drug resistance transporter
MSKGNPVTTTAAPQYHTSGNVPLTRPQLVGTLTGLVLALFLAALDQTIVGTAEPRIIADLSGFDRYPWVATVYLLTSTIAVPIFASLSDMYGRKPFFLVGAILFVVTSALCGAAGKMSFLPFDGMGQLILFRGLQGIGAGMVLGLIFTIIGDIFSPTERGSYQGLFASVFGLSSIFGPTLGGWLTDSVSWRACFLVNLPVGVIVVTTIYLQFPHFKPRGTRRHLDWAGFATLIGCVVPLLLALTWVTQYGWGSTRVVSLLGLAAVMLVAFLVVEMRAPEPVIPLSIFRNPVISVCAMCGFILGMGMFGVIIYLPLFMQGVLGVSPTRSGNLLTPLMMGAVFGSTISGQAIARSGQYKAVAVTGSILAATGAILFARMDASTQWFYVAVGMIISGLGMGLLQPVYTVAVQNAAPRNVMGAATSSTVFFRSIGSTMGVSIFGSIMLTRYHREFGEALPPRIPSEALTYFSNPLTMVQMRGQLEKTFAQIPGGLEMLQTIVTNVRTALVHGLQVIFFWSAIVMTASILLHLVLRSEPLRSRTVEPELPVA